MMELILKLLKKQPEVAFEIIRGYINQYKPVAYGLAKEYLSIAKDYTECDELHKIKAANKKKMFDAYKEAGFTDDQALALILNDNLQLMKNLKEISANSSNTTYSVSCK